MKRGSDDAVWVTRRRLALGVLAISTVALALNDHVLKGHPAFPGWFTGKLSDFAGLIVAPLTLILLFDVRTPGARRFCTFAPALIFAAINLSDACSEALVEALGMIGVSWRLWPDAADLWSLMVVPLATRLGAWMARPAATAERDRWLPRRVLALAGAVACLASGDPPPARHNAPAYLVNRTGRPLVLEVAYLRGQINCQGPALPSDFLRHDDFAEGTRYLLLPNGVLPLGSAARMDTCGPVRVVLPHLTLGVAWDNNLPNRTVDNTITDEQLRDTPQLVLIPRDGSSTPFTFGKGTRRIGIVNDTDPLPTSSCVQATLPRLEFSAQNSGIYGLEVLRKEPVGDECFRLTLAPKPVGSVDAGAGGESGESGESGAGGQSSEGGEGGAAGEPGASGEAGSGGAGGSAPAIPANAHELYLCMPIAEFPFVPGDLVSGSVTDTELRIWRAADGVHEVALYRGLLNPMQTTMRFAPAECGLIRDRCGAIWEALDAFASGGNQLLTPGERVQVRSDPPITYQVMRAWRPVVMRPDCDPAAAMFGTWVEYIERKD